MSRKTALEAVQSAAGARLGPDGEWEVALDFGAPEEERQVLADTAGLLDATDRGVFRFEGPDAARFLQNMTSNDVAGLQLGAGCYTIFANKKGKLITDATTLRVAPDAFLVELPDSQRGPLTTALGKYIALDDAEMIDASDELAELLVSGPRAPAVITALGLDARGWKTLQHESLEWQGGSLRVVLAEPWTGEATFALMVERRRVEALWNELLERGAPAGLRPVGRLAFHAARIEAGYPWFGIDMDEERLPMEAGLEERAISYTKGCYIGQEVIARVKYKGHVNRHLVRVRIDGAEALPSGTSLFVGEANVGEITSSTPARDDNFILALAYVRHGHETSGTELHVADRRAVVL